MTIVETLRQRAGGLVSHLENRTFSAYWLARAQLITKHLDPQPTDTILEIGSGAGLWASWYTPKVGRFVGVDIDRGSLAHSRSWRSPRGPLRPTQAAQLIAADAVRLPFRDDALPKILGIDVLGDIPDGQGAVHEAYRVLQPGGRAIFTILLEERPSYLHKFPSQYQREYTHPEFLTLFRRAGFTIRHTFFFYYLPGTLSRELQRVLNEGLRWSPLTRLGASVVISPLARLDRALPIGRPSGIGVHLTKPAM